MVNCACLENKWSVKRLRGSNPFLTASLTHKLRIMAKNIHFNISEYRNIFWIIASDKESGLWYGTLTASSPSVKNSNEIGSAIASIKIVARFIMEQTCISARQH